MRSAKAALVLGILVACTVPARAQPTKDCDASARSKALDKADLAQSAYRTGDFQRALGLFEEAYATCPNPTLLYNIARVQERLGAFAKAIASYEEYLREVPNVPDRRGIEQGIRTLREKVAELERLANQLETREPSPPAPPKPPEKPRPPPEPPNTTLPWVTVSVGLAGLVAAGVVGGLAQREYGQADDGSQRNAVEHLDRGDDFRSWTIGLAISGGVLTAAGLTWLWVAGSPDDDSTTAFVGAQGRW